VIDEAIRQWRARLRAGVDVAFAYKLKILGLLSHLLDTSV